MCYTVQYFERYRFEYHPEYAGTPWEVSLGLLGTQIAPQTYPTAPVPADQSIRYFSATQHTLSGAFRSYWEASGGLAMFGYPTSEPFEQDGTLVQYFERARFEFHSDLPAGSASTIVATWGSVGARARLPVLVDELDAR